MNKQIYLFVLMLTCKVCNAQNLIPNGDFEQFSGCPNSMGQLSNALFWINPTLQGSPDYFNQCAIGPANVPNANWGYQPAHSGGGYCGIDIRDESVTEGREYIEVPFNRNIVSKYVLSFSNVCKPGKQLRYYNR
jgi:hypothetical protein